MEKANKVEMIVPESAAEASPFVRLFETEGRARVMDALLSQRDVALSQQEIADIADVDKSTVYRNMDVLVDIGAVIQTDPRHGPKLYQANMEMPAMQALRAAREELLTHATSIEFDQLQRSEVTEQSNLPNRPTLPAEAFNSAIQVSRGVPDLLEEQSDDSDTAVING